MTNHNIDIKKDNLAQQKQEKLFSKAIHINGFDEDKSASKEFGGPKGLEPTRYGQTTPEWEVKGRVSDF